jgi:hypothetical protein
MLYLVDREAVVDAVVRPEGEVKHTQHENPEYDLDGLSVFYGEVTQHVQGIIPAPRAQPL